MLEGQAVLFHVEQAGFSYEEDWARKAICKTEISAGLTPLMRLA